MNSQPEGEKIERLSGSGEEGIAHMHAGLNNTIITITNLEGAVLGWSSAGKCGFKGSRKASAFAADRVARDAGQQAWNRGIRGVEVICKGTGDVQDSVIRALEALGIRITLIKRAKFRSRPG